MSDSSKSTGPRRPTYRFAGFTSPNYTQVPDVVFDELLAELTESELKVLLYIIRRTFGFKKDADTISLKQMTEGIRTRDGRQLDRGAGVSKTSAVRGVNGLIEKGVIVAVRRRSEEKGDEPTVYQLRFHESDPDRNTPVSRFETPPSPNLEHPRVPDLDPQETVNQQTERQEDPSMGPRPERWDLVDFELVNAFIRDWGRELGDEAELQASSARAAGLWAKSGVDQEAFLAAMAEARTRTKRFTGSIAKQRGDGNGKNKMPYFFGVLERLLA